MDTTSLIIGLLDYSRPASAIKTDQINLFVREMNIYKNIYCA